jgi:E1A-binding protein p400
MEKHMDFMVGQTERYSQLLATEINKPGRVRGAKDDPNADPDFQPSDAADDEATLMEEEGAGSNAAEKEAVDAMGKEGAAPIADVLEKHGVDKDAAAAGEIPDQSAESGSGAMDLELPGEEVSAEDAAARATEDADLAMLLEANSIDLTDEEKKLQKKNTARMSSASSEAKDSQPKGWTLSTAGQGADPIETPFLIKASLREYQSVALKWMIALYDKRLNGILADEMGLGKTLMTISMLAYLAVERGVWGPHLIVVPTSVMLNWEIEFKKWAPAFKVVTYYGSQKERKEKRLGWSKQNAFHICITSYQLVVQDQHVFRRKKWGYLILDEAHHIKNFQSQRWQTMLNFNAKRRLLITGTPLQNNLMELWSLMHFLMPQIFASHKEFKEIGRAHV